MKNIFAALGVVILTLALLTGCHTPPLNCVFVGSGTTLGFDVSESPATQTPQATLAYKRVEIAVVPVTTNGITPDVIMDFSFHSDLDLFSSYGGIYSRIAVGPNATTQLPAALMMSKSRNGIMPTNILNVIPLLTPKPNK